MSTCSKQQEVAASQIVDLLAGALACDPVDRAGVETVRGEVEEASPRDWLQQVVAVSEPTQVKP